MDDALSTSGLITLAGGGLLVAGAGVGYAAFCLVRPNPPSRAVTTLRVASGLGVADVAMLYRWGAMNLFVGEEWSDHACGGGPGASDGVARALPLGLGCRTPAGVVDAAIPTWLNPTLASLLAAVVGFAVASAVLSRRVAPAATA